MSVVAESPLYVMPSVGVGDAVCWYSTCTESQADANLAYVMEVGQNALSLAVHMKDGRTVVKYDVHHVADPVLAYNQHMRAFGAWGHSHQTNLLVELERRVAALEDGGGRRKLVDYTSGKWIDEDTCGSLVFSAAVALDGGKSMRIGDLAAATGSSPDALMPFLTEENGFVRNATGWYSLKAKAQPTTE